MTKKDPIPKDIFDILACPICKSDLEYDKGKKNLICTKCKKKYLIEGEIALLTPPED